MQGLAAELPVGAAGLPRRLDARAARRRALPVARRARHAARHPAAVPHLLLLRHLREAREGEGHLRRRARQLPPGARRVGASCTTNCARRSSRWRPRSSARAASRPTSSPRRPRTSTASSSSSASSSSARWAATTTTTSPSATAAWAIVCGDVMGKGLAAALIMAMARSLLHDAIGPGKRPGDVMAEVNDGLTRDLEGQRLPYFLTLALAVYDPATAASSIAGGGHNPVLVAGEDGVREVPSRGAALGVRTGLHFPEDDVVLAAGRHRGALHRRPHRGARPRRRRCSAWSASSSSLARCQNAPVRDTLADRVGRRRRVPRRQRPHRRRHAPAGRVSRETAERQRRLHGVS